MENTNARSRDKTNRMRPNIRPVWVPEAENKGKEGREKFKKVVVENFLEIRET